MELRGKDQESAILARILPNKGNGSSTEVMYKLAVQGSIGAVRPVGYHYGSRSRRILQVEFINMRSWRQEADAYHYG